MNSDARFLAVLLFTMLCAGYTGWNVRRVAEAVHQPPCACGAADGGTSR